MSKHIEKRLAYLRGEIEAERISQSEILELQSLAKHIEPGDVQLLEWAGVPEKKSKTPKPVSQRAFVKSGGNCPFCGESNVEGKGVEVSETGATQEVSCTECGAVWIDEHKRTGFTVVTAPEPQVTCSLCGKNCNADGAHLHGGEWIGDECCWDERLRSSE
jgi:hypothetical protein